MFQEIKMSIKLKFGTNTISNMLNSMVIFCFRPQLIFLGKFAQRKIKIVFKGEELEYAEFDGVIKFFCLIPETFFIYKSGKKESKIFV